MVIIAFGYGLEKGEIIIDEEMAKDVIKLYENYLKVRNIKAAAKGTAVETKYVTSIGKILKDKKYLGTELYPRIISDELFNEVQKVRNEIFAKQNRSACVKMPYEYPTDFHFRIDKIEKKYADPIAQAEYAYGQIREVEDGQ